MENNDDNKNQLDKLREQFSKKENQGGGKKPPQKKFNYYWIYGLILIGLIGLQILNLKPNLKESNWKEFYQQLKADDVKEVVIINEMEVQVSIKKEAIKNKDDYSELNKKNMSGEISEGPHFHFDMPQETFETRLQQAYEDFGVTDGSEKISVKYEQRKDITGEILGWVIPIAIMVIIWIFIMRRLSGGAGGGAGGQIFNIGKSKATLFDKNTNVKITFKDVAGLEGAKEEVQEIVDFLKNPKKYTNLGGKIPKGALLVGPPGTGKTLLAKAVAGEAKVPFFSLSGSDFVEMFVGVGASRVRDLFKQAKEKSPAIIFIDEIDAIGRARGKSQVTGGNDERENTLNQLLTEMDGFGTNDNVIVLAATNRADILDRALMRAGRFDRQVHVDLPDLNERKEIFEVHLRPIKKDDSLDINFLAKQTPGFSGADIANVCNESALIAARKGKEQVTRQDFLDAVDRIVGGLEKKNKIITADEKKAVAFHEAGHATVSWLLEHAAPLVKVTIVPRGRSLGAAWYLPEERSLTTTEQMLDEMCATLGGRAAEEVIFGKISTGALSDLEKVTKQANAMVTIYGLNKKVGNISYYDSSGQQDYFGKPYSEETAKTIDEEIRTMIEAQYERAKKLLKDNNDKLTKLAELLLEKEVIFKENLEEIFGKRPWDKEEESEKKVTTEKAELNGTTPSANGATKTTDEPTDDKKPEEPKAEEEKHDS